MNLSAIDPRRLPVLCILACVSAGAQDAAQFSSKVELVMVPVVVRDRQGQAVGTLKKEDFLLFDRGKPQLISHFEVEHAGPPESTPANAAALPNRFVAIVFDDLHLPLGDLEPARKAARQHLAESLPPNERVAIYTTSGKVMLDFTSDREKIEQALGRIQPYTYTGENDCPPMNYYQADLIINKHDEAAMSAATSAAIRCANLPPTPGGIRTAQGMAESSALRTLSNGDQNGRNSLMMLAEIARRMSAAPGERVMIMVSPGFVLTDYNRMAATAVIDRAAGSKVTINAMDAHGVYSASQVNNGVLGDFADGTGGVLFEHNNDLLEGFRQTARRPEFTYILGFEPRGLKLDGSYHALKVSLNLKNGATLTARRGYNAPEGEVSQTDRAIREMRDALFSHAEIEDIPLDLDTRFITENGKTRLGMELKIDLKPLHFKKAEGTNNDSIVIVAGAFDRNGNMVSAIQKTVNIRLKDAMLESPEDPGTIVNGTLDVAPGNYVVRVVMRETQAGMITARNHAVSPETK